ncbi:MAG: DNA alkylation repair protein [Pirellulaceae bacterium]
METLSAVMSELKKLGTEQTRKTYSRHGAPENLFGVKVGDMKTIVKKIKGNQDLALELFDTENVDAMYLAGLVADGSKMNKRQLDAWAKKASWYMISEYSVPWVATENPAGRELALKWMKAKQPNIASTGWATYTSIMSVTPDEELDLKEIETLLDRVVKEIDAAPNRVRYTMNGFVIAAGSFVKPMLKKAKETAKKIGEVHVEMGNTACKVPLATDYIAKIEKMKRVGKKRAAIKC